jgi:phenylacetate-CoA ligase
MTEGEYFQPQIETMPRAQLDELQEQKLRALVGWTYERSPFYRQRWQKLGVTPLDLRSTEEFVRHTPTLTKADLIAFRDAENDPYCGLLCVPATEVNNIGTTSGTTAEPMPLVELVSGAPPFASTLRDMWGAGLRPGDRVLHCMATQRGPQERVYHEIGCIPLMINVRQGADWPAVFEMIRRHQPAHIYLLGPMIADLDRLSQDYDLASIFACIRFAVVTGEPLGARMRARMMGDWGLHLYEVTGAADTGVAWDCRAHAGFHLWDDYVFAEALDPDTGGQVAEGEIGELVCTALANLAWPLIRHRSGDLVRLIRAPCECGRTHTRFELHGRISDKLRVADKLVMPGQIWRAIEQFDETSAAVFQIVHPGGTNVDVLRIRVGYNPRRTASVDELAQRLRQTVLSTVGISPILELSPEVELLARSPSGIKLPRVVKS